jgi:hypothetical protein
MNTQLNTHPATDPADAPAAQPAARRPYEPPKATFVPLKLEERLLACDKATDPPCYYQDLYT